MGGGVPDAHENSAPSLLPLPSGAGARACPFAELVGDASGANDPAWGNGLSHTLHDVRLLRDQLLANEDWTRAGDEYGKASSADLKALRNVTGWLTEILLEVGPEAKARREKVIPLLRSDKSRSPDFIALGPKVAHDETARRRLFGEE